VTLLSASPTLDSCNSWWAQGGIIYRNYDDPSDTVDSLASDIEIAGAGLCRKDAVMKLSRDGPGVVEEQLLTGSPFAKVPFDTSVSDPSKLAFCLEACHSAKRIIHYKDKSGMLITKHMQEAVLACPNITVLTSTVVTDLLVDEHPSSNGGTVVGAAVYNTVTDSTAVLHAAHGTVLAAGGLAGIYQHSTNPTGFNALGSSVALATRAGAAVTDLEFVQFHPTALYIANEPRFLLSEALRGEGAKLRDIDDHEYARDYHPSGELAPRDVVARANFMQGRKTRKNNFEASTFLDISHRDSEWLVDRFPGIDAYLRERGIDFTKQKLPCVPAAHYTCGGVSADLVGRTSLKGLFACGEAARTGLHGGNRLASTSLLEGLVWGQSVANQVIEDGAVYKAGVDGGVDGGDVPIAGDRSEVAAQALKELENLKRVMWDNVGIVRTKELLSAAVVALEETVAVATELYERRLCEETIMLRDASIAGLGVARAALANPRSQGTHYIELEEEEAAGEMASRA
jgi:L-aspartate oxidase